MAEAAAAQATENAASAEDTIAAQQTEAAETGDIFRNGIVVFQFRFIESAICIELIPEQAASLHGKISAGEIDSDKDVDAGEDLVLRFV